MKHKVFITFIVLCALLLAVAGSVGAQTASIRYVDVDATGANNGTSWTDAFTDLQSALAAASSGSGDEIWVAEGTYKPTSGTDRAATFQLKNGVALYGGFAGTETARNQRNWVANPTTLSGDIGTLGDNSDNSYHVVTGSGTDTTAVLDGFTITGGNANGTDSYNHGGGMYNYVGSPTLTNVTFSGNSAGFGGGMYNRESSPTLTDVTFSGNSAYYYGSGGGMFNWESSPTLTNVTFSGNSAYYRGGGMFNYNSSPTLTNVTFSGNSAVDVGGGMYNWESSPTLVNVTFSGNSAQWVGGGMYNWESSPTLTNVTFSGNSANLGGGMCNDYGSPTLTGVTFSSNSARYGGGMLNGGGSPTLTNVTFSGNSAVDEGGGMYNEGGSPTLTNVTFSGNSAEHYGGGMYNWESSPTLTNVTFSGNSAGDYGGGMSNHYSSPTLTNGILWGNTASFGPQIYNESSSPSVSYSLVQGGHTGTGNISDDPQFVDADGPDDMVGTLDDDLRLQATSPAIDDGDNSALPADTLDLDSDGDIAEPLPFDLDGNPRIVNGTVDMGAYEYQNNPPTAVDDAYSTDEDTLLDVAAPGVLENDSDPDDDTLAVASFSQPAHGMLTLNNDDGSFTYTPDADFNGTDGFTYKANDGNLDSNEATVTITVNAVNDAPVVSADPSTVTADEGQTATNIGAVSDVEGDTVTLSASVGTVANNGGETWSWEFATSDGPAESQTVTIFADDGNGGTSETTFPLTVNNVAPSVGPINAPDEPVVVGTVVNASAPFSDPGLLDTHTAVWDWGDDTTTDPATLTQDAGEGWVEDSHTYLSAGEYTIRLTVTDKDGGEGSATHPLTVHSPSEAIDSVVDEVEGLADLPDGIQNELTSKLDNALDDLDREQDKAAVGKLNAFINSVEAQRGNKISETDADALIQTVQEIINAINAGLL